MSVDRLQLRKLLELFFLVGSRRDSRIREKIRNEISTRFAERDAGGGDFHSPFWHDAKSFAASEIDLREATRARISQNRRRERLYNLLTDGFLKWWNERRGWANAKYKIYPNSVRTRYIHPGTGGTIKIDNFLSVELEDKTHRHIYPYFSERPSINRDSARVGLYVIQEAFPTYNTGEFYILDVLRGTAYSIGDTPLHGNEEALLRENYRQLRSDWARLRAFYS